MMSMNLLWLLIQIDDIFAFEKNYINFYSYLQFKRCFHNNFLNMSSLYETFHKLSI